MPHPCSSIGCHEPALRKLFSRWVCDRCYDFRVLVAHIEAEKHKRGGDYNCPECGHRLTLCYPAATPRETTYQPIRYLCLHCHDRDTDLMRLDWDTVTWTADRLETIRKEKEKLLVTLGGAQYERHNGGSRYRRPRLDRTRAHHAGRV